MSVGLITDSSYSKSWWGEGEVKMYIDSDTKYPTIVGTGSEDYIGSAWGLGIFLIYTRVVSLQMTQRVNSIFIAGTYPMQFILIKI